MRIAQELYEGIDTGEGDTGLITYMRTDSVTVAGVAGTKRESSLSRPMAPDHLPEKPPICQDTIQDSPGSTRGRSTHVGRANPAAMKPHLSGINIGCIS